MMLNLITRRQLLRLLRAGIGFALLVPFLLATAHAAAAAVPASQAGCITCAYFNSLATLKTEFSLEVFNDLAPQLAPLLQGAMTILIIFIAGRAMVTGNIQHLSGVVKLAILLPILGVAMQPGTVSNPPLIYKWIIDPIEELGLGIGQQVLAGTYALVGQHQLQNQAVASAVAAAQTGTPSYGALAAIVEAQIFSILNSIYSGIISPSLNAGGVLNGSFFVNLIAGIMLILPYLFVICIWGAFMVEAMFKFLAVGIVAPLLVFAAAIGSTRSFATAGVRILAGAAFTIIFACGALGFSMSVVDTYAGKLQVSTSNTAPLNSPQYKNALAAYNAAGCNTYNNIVNNNNCSALNQNLTNIIDGYTHVGPSQAFKIFTPSYWRLFIIGFASVLLHLAAKTMASTLTGANDGPGPAAATVAAGKMVLGGGAFALSRAAFGSGGIGGSLQDMARGNAPPGSLGQGMAQHGLVGGAAYSATSMMNALGGGSGGGGGGGGPPGGGDGFGPSFTGGGPQYSGGGAKAPPMPPEMVKGFATMNKHLENIAKAVDPKSAQGGGRNRLG